MLPAGCAHKLVSLLTWALEECTEPKQQLQQNLTLCQAVLGDWNSQASESPILQDSRNGDKESELSFKEQEELELLNKALEKALRIRTKFLPTPCKAAERAKTANKKPASSSALKNQVINCKESVAKNIKVTSVSKKTASSKTPSAYMLKAPYRTDPEVKRSQVKLLSSRASKGYGKKSPKGAASPKAKVPVKITRVEFEKACSVEGPRILPGSSESLQNAKQNSSFGSCADEGDFAVASSLLAEAKHNFLNPTGESLVTKTQMGEDSHMCTKSRTSTLQEEGSLLKLPLPYKKALARNARLWEKFRLCQMSQDAAAARNRFMERLQTTFCSPSTAFSPVEVKEELMHLHESHSLLRHCMEAETADSPGENLPWRRQYENLLTLEGLKTMVSQCLHKVHQLSEALESHVKLFPAAAACSEERCSSLDCAALRSDRCCGVKDVGPPPLLYYSSLKELRTMETLKLQVAMLHQRINIQKVMQAELLPLLESEDAQESMPASLYRAIYTLLGEGCERFPVLVNDEEPSSRFDTEVLAPGLEDNVCAIRNEF